MLRIVTKHDVSQARRNQAATQSMLGNPSVDRDVLVTYNAHLGLVYQHPLY